MSSHWEGGERRKQFADMDQIKKDLSDTRTDVAILINKVDANHESLRKTVIHIEELLEKHNKTLYGNGIEGLTSKVRRLEDKKNDLKDHTNADRWAFGLIITIQSAILLKQFWPH